MTRHAGRPPRRHTAAAAVLAASLALVGVAACTGSNASSSVAGRPVRRAGTGGGPSSSVSSAGGAAAAASAAPAAPADGSAAAPQSVALDVAAAARSRILTATVTLRVGDVGRAVATATGAALGAGGYVGSATTTAASGPGTGPTANLVLRVPDPQFDSVVTQVSAPAVGRVTSSAQTQSDVTGQVADLASRLATQQQSLARVRVLFARATSVGQVIALESALTDRESTLESLQAQQRALAGQVDDATITLTLLGPGVRAAVVVHPHARQAGFASGLRGGWHALQHLGRGVAAVAGALLPFVPLLAVLAGLGWWLTRRQRRQRPPPTRPTPTGTPGA